MKTKITILAAVFTIATISSFATVFTVSNHPLGGAQYNSLQAAYNAAVNGDTLILEGTNINYSYATGCSSIWDKSLTVIGAGFNTDKQNFKKTYISGQGCYGGSFVITSTASGSSFFGIVFNLYTMTLSGTNSNITFEDCVFLVEFYTAYNVSTNNLVFRNCIFENDNGFNIGLAAYGNSTVSIINCVFDGYILGNSNSLNTLLVDHCLFLRNNDSPLWNVINASISNCIFMNWASVAGGGTSGCIFLNNIARLNATLPPAGSSGSGNLSNTDPSFTTYTLGSLYSPSHDYQLQAGSPCLAAGSDGTDIGVHGGTSDFSEYGEPLIVPVVRSVQINNAVVAPNGTLDVDVSASKPADD